MTEETKQCVACAEDIKGGAKLCRFCGTDQESSRYSLSFGTDAPPAALDPRIASNKSRPRWLIYLLVGVLGIGGSAAAWFIFSAGNPEVRACQAFYVSGGPLDFRTSQNTWSEAAYLYVDHLEPYAAAASGTVAGHVMGDYLSTFSSWIRFDELETANPRGSELPLQFMRLSMEADEELTRACDEVLRSD
jgi:hypothetical protein